jgi:hypothetical protein
MATKTAQSRQPKGKKTGGQFAESKNPEVQLSLIDYLDEVGREPEAHAGPYPAIHDTYVNDRVASTLDAAQPDIAFSDIGDLCEMLSEDIPDAHVYVDDLKNELIKRGLLRWRNDGDGGELFATIEQWSEVVDFIVKSVNNDPAVMDALHEDGPTPDEQARARGFTSYEELRADEIKHSGR